MGIKCEYCGTPISIKTNHCPSCGAPLPEHYDPEAEKIQDVNLTQNTGLDSSLNNAQNQEALRISSGVPNISPFKQIHVLVLCFFLGFIGVHRFYTGRYISAIIMVIIFLLGLFKITFFLITAIWVLFDFFWLCLGKFVDSKGRLIKRN